jgi:hypothetical protein
MKDFSRTRKQILFQIDGDTFEAASAVPAEILVEFANRFNDVSTKNSSPSELFEALMGVFELVLLETSFDKLRTRGRDRANPVEIDQLSDIVLWLLEEYGLRPTQLSSNSSPGPENPASGTSSTDSTPAAVSTSSPSLSTVS